MVTQATDGYEVVLSLAELDTGALYGATSCGTSVNDNVCDLLPYAGSPISPATSNFPGSGVARTVLPADSAHGRWESNLTAVTVQNAIPEPGSMVLFGMAVLAIGAARRRFGRSSLARPERT